MALLRQHPNSDQTRLGGLFRNLIRVNKSDQTASSDHFCLIRLFRQDIGVLIRLLGPDQNPS